MKLGRLRDARSDLEAVLTTENLFAGTAPDALVGLAELERLEGHVEEVLKCIDSAVNSIDIRDYTLVEGQVVLARLLADGGDVEEARRVWQGVLSNPNANTYQRSVAAKGIAVVAEASEDHSIGGRGQQRSRRSAKGARRRSRKRSDT